MLIGRGTGSCRLPLLPSGPGPRADRSREWRLGSRSQPRKGACAPQFAPLARRLLPPAALVLSTTTSAGSDDVRSASPPRLSPAREFSRAIGAAPDRRAFGV